jgi:hypothetical protein
MLSFMAVLPASFKNLYRQSETVNAAKVPAQNLHNFCGREQLLNAYESTSNIVQFPSCTEAEVMNV